VSRQVDAHLGIMIAASPPQTIVDTAAKPWWTDFGFLKSYTPVDSWKTVRTGHSSAAVSSYDSPM
jgi:hypothetical protein